MQFYVFQYGSKYNFNKAPFQHDFKLQKITWYTSNKAAAIWVFAFKKLKLKI